MSMPARTTLTDSLVTQLKRITVVDGARTDIGKQVFIGQHPVNDNELPCCTLTPAAELPGADSRLNGDVQISYSVTGYLNRRETSVDYYPPGPGPEYVLIDAIVADIRDRIESEACAYSSAVSALVYQGATPLYHEDGGDACGAEVRYLITTPIVDYIPGQ